MISLPFTKYFLPILLLTVQLPYFRVFKLNLLVLTMASISLFLMAGAVLTASVYGSLATNYYFAIPLYQNLAKNNLEKNVVLFPYSLEIALSLASIGASGPTRLDLASTLLGDVYDTPDMLKNKMQSRGKKEGDYVLTADIDAMGTRRFPTKREFDRNSFLNEFGSNERYLMDAIRSKSPITARASDTLKFLPLNGTAASGMLDTVMTVRNGAIFTSTWKSPFKTSATRDGDFTLTNGQNKKVKMMQASGKFGYLKSAELSDAEIVELKCQGGETSLVIIRPKKGTSLTALESSLTPIKLETALNSLIETELHFRLPKLEEVKGSYDMETAMKEAISIRTAFGTQAEFTDVASSGERLKISLTHNPSIKLDESDGSFSGDTTATSTGQQLHFSADYPFMFLIRNIQAKYIIFVGRVADPTQTA